MSFEASTNAKWTRAVLPARPNSRRANDVPASGAWQEQHPTHGKKFLDVGDLLLETGSTLPNVRIAYETWGTLNAAQDNAVLLLHALTGDSHVTRANPQDDSEPVGWWESLVGPGAPIDTDKYFVVAPNVVGGCQGSTGPSSPAPDGKPWGSQFPVLTIRDLVNAEILFAKALEITHWSLVVGGSMGGLRVLE